MLPVHGGLKDSTLFFLDNNKKTIMLLVLQST